MLTKIGIIKPAKPAAAPVTPHLKPTDNGEITYVMKFSEKDIEVENVEHNHEQHKENDGEGISNEPESPISPLSEQVKEPENEQAKKPENEQVKEPEADKEPQPVVKPEPEEIDMFKDPDAYYRWVMDGRHDNMNESENLLF